MSTNGPAHSGFLRRPAAVMVLAIVGTTAVTGIAFAIGRNTAPDRKPQAATTTQSHRLEPTKTITPAAPSSTAVPSTSIAGMDASNAPGVATVSCPSSGQTVSSAEQLTKALTSAGPGSVIRLTEGTYPGTFTISQSATANKPAWLCGNRAAILDGGGTSKGYGLHLQHADYWRVIGLSVTNAQKGVVVDATSNAVIQDLSVRLIGDEGIHLRSASTRNLVIGNTVSDTGHRKAKFGEGIYVGSAKKNWCKWSACGPDRSDYNVIARNTISATTSENVDIKEGTEHGRLVANSFSGKGGLTGADSWVDVKGNNWTIADNTGTDSPADGFQTHQIVKGWGTANIFSGNKSAVNGPGFAIHLAPVENNIVRCSNTEAGAGKGLSNIACG
jgi:nitrous oxidase accessory protein NosD